MKNQSEIPLPFNFGLTWAKSLEKFSDKELEEIFDFVIKENNWKETDEVIALGEYGLQISR
ncbi:MAG: hypothetical protein ACR2HG_00295 [Pyrinomonadaceae bacterium]